MVAWCLLILPFHGVKSGWHGIGDIDLLDVEEVVTCQVDGVARFARIFSVDALQAWTSACHLEAVGCFASASHNADDVRTAIESCELEAIVL